MHCITFYVVDDLSDAHIAAANETLKRPFGELPIETRCLIFALHQAGKIGVIVDGNEVLPSFLPGATYQIRRKEVPLVPDSIDWSHVSPEWKFMARDENGLMYAYTERPTCETAAGFWSRDNSQMFPLRAFASYKRGTVDWKDSLVVRPE